MIVVLLKGKEHLYEIKKNRKMLLRFRREFLKILNEYGEYLIEPIPTKDIIDIFIVQGYWNGNLYRIYYDGESFHAEKKSI
ncbi:MAG: hypothetical protein ACOYEB_07430 [Enterococcus lemanii]|jgi:hypothetical protein